MNDKGFRFCQKWLNYASITTIGVGVLVAFAGNSIVFELHNEYAKEVFLSASEFDPDVLNLKNWLFGIVGGAIVIRFHILMVMISENAK